MRILLWVFVGIVIILAPSGASQAPEATPAGPEAPVAEAPSQPVEPEVEATAPEAQGPDAETTADEAAEEVEETVEEATGEAATQAAEAQEQVASAQETAEGSTRVHTASPDAQAGKGVSPDMDRYLCTVVEDEAEGDGESRSLECVPAGSATGGDSFRLTGDGPWSGFQTLPDDGQSVAANMAVPSSPQSQWWALGALGLVALGLGTWGTRRPIALGPVPAPQPPRPETPAEDPLSLEALVKRVDENPMEGASSFQLAMALFERGDDEDAIRYLDRAVRLDPLVLLPLLKEPAYEATRQRPDVRRLLRGVQRERERALVGYV